MPKKINPKDLVGKDRLKEIKLTFKRFNQTKVAQFIGSLNDDSCTNEELKQAHAELLLS